MNIKCKLSSQIVTKANDSNIALSSARPRTDTNGFSYIPDGAGWHETLLSRHSLFTILLNLSASPSVIGEMIGIEKYPDKLAES